MTKLYQGDVGIPIYVATGITLTGASFVAFRVKKPSGRTVSWTAVIDPINAQQLNYTTLLNDLDEIGTYFLQSHVQINGQTLFGQTAEFFIYGPYQ